METSSPQMQGILQQYIQQIENLRYNIIQYYMYILYVCIIYMFVQDMYNMNCGLAMCTVTVNEYSVVVIVVFNTSVLTMMVYIAQL